MRTDQPWLDVARNVRQALSAKPQPLVEEEVAPGRILFGPGRGQWLALFGVVFGMAGAGTTMTVGAHRGANSAAIAETLGVHGCGGNTLALLNCFGDSPVQDIGHREMFAILPSGRRLGPTQ